LTFDTWTSLVGDPFIGVTAHYITAPDDNPHQWELKNELLAFTPLEGDHSGANIGSILIDTLDTYGIRSKVIYFILFVPDLLRILIIDLQTGWFTADNATNNDTALRLLPKPSVLSGTPLNIVSGNMSTHICGVTLMA
jgi:hypothetical protein